jgi:methyl-accepting chemotaxis protein
MPMTMALLVFSWLIAILGILAGGYLIIFKFGEINSLVRGLSISLGSLLLAAVIRMFSNIGQMLFDLKDFLFNDLQTLIETSTTLSQEVKETREALSQSLLNLNQDLKDQLQGQTTVLTEGLEGLDHSFSSELQSLKNNFEQTSCDSKDISQNIHQITTFFDQIERHLDLKK